MAMRDGEKRENLPEQTSSNAATADPSTRLVRSCKSFSIIAMMSSFISGSKLYSLGIACAAVFRT